MVPSLKTCSVSGVCYSLLRVLQAVYAIVYCLSVRCDDWLLTVILRVDCHFLTGLSEIRLGWRPRLCLGRFSTEGLGGGGTHQCTLGLRWPNCFSEIKNTFSGCGARGFSHSTPCSRGIRDRCASSRNDVVADYDGGADWH